MEKEFIPYEQALELKELGFDEECLCTMYTDIPFNESSGNPIKQLRIGCGAEDDDAVSLFDTQKFVNSQYVNYYITVPLYQQAFRWFREKYGIFSSTWCFETEQKFFIEFGFGIHKFEIDNEGEVELECLKKIIEIVKNK